MIQILALRPVFNPKKNIWENLETYFDKGWRAESVTTLFADLDAHLNHIPASERWNLFYTLAHCFEKRGRQFERLEHIAFDIDGILNWNDEVAARLREVACNTLGIVSRETIAVNSGNGLHLILELHEPITSPEFFDRNKGHYRAVLEKLERACWAHGFEGAHADPAIFHKACLMRLPGTENRKPDKLIEKFPGPDEPKLLKRRPVTLLSGVCVPVPYILAERSGLPDMKPTDAIAHDAIKKFPHPDSNAVLTGCEFLKRCKAEPSQVTEPEWYAMLSILPHVYGQSPEGMAKARELVHEYSRGHGSYTPEETEAKIDQATAASGPRTCKNINSLWGNCKTCPHFNTTLISPIMIRGEDYIRTEFTGFHDEKITAQGHITTGKPNYEDLRKFFRRQNPYIVLEGANIVYTWTGTHWEEFIDAKLEKFAYDNFHPKPLNQTAREFCGAVFKTQHKKSDWFTDSIARKMNFLNGVLNIDTMEFGAHSKECGFRSVLPYNYDKEAVAPMFDKFLEDTLQDSDLKKICLEFAGYAFSNDECWAQKALILYGVGGNGKSQFIDVLKALAGGPGQYGALTLGDLNNDTKRYLIEGKPFNLAEETPSNALIDSSIFKNLVTGGEMIVKVLYKQPYTIKSKAKHIVSCNKIPVSPDQSSALYRRMIIIPWLRNFEGAPEQDPFILKKLLTELPGIFNMVIDGYKRLKTQGRFTGSQKSEDALNEYKEESDSLIPWTRDCLVITPLTDTNSEFCSLIDMYKEYYEWARIRGYKAVGFNVFNKKMYRYIPEALKRKDRRREHKSSNAEGKVVGFKGVKLLREGTDF